MTVLNLTKHGAYSRSFGRYPSQVAIPMRSGMAADSKKELPATIDRVKEWTLHLLLLSATAAAMWFVVTEGWVQLMGMWAFNR